MSASYILCSNSSPAMLYSSYPKMFSSTFLWECHGRPWGDCEKTFPNGTHIHRRHTCCLFDAPSLNKCWIMTQPPKYLNLTTLTCLCHTARSRTVKQIVNTILTTHRCQWTLQGDGIAHPSFVLAPSSQRGWRISSITVKILYRVVFHKESYPMQPWMGVGSSINNI